MQKQVYYPKAVETTGFAYDNPRAMNAEPEKQGPAITVRLEPKLRELARILAKERGATDTSDYIRGLLVADAVKQNKPLSGIQIPGWLIDNLVELQLVTPRSSVPSPPEGNEARGRPHEPTEDKSKPRKKS